jgi:hypothetical protein
MKASSVKLIDLGTSQDCIEMINAIENDPINFSKESGLRIEAENKIASLEGLMAIYETKGYN